MSRRRGHGRSIGALAQLAEYAESADIKLAGMAGLTEAMRFLESATSMKAGTFVSWPASKGVGQGRVVSVHTGKVPGIVTQTTASVEVPAARVQLYAKVGKGWAPTAVYLGHPVGALSTIDALPEPAAEAEVVGSFDEIRQNVQTAIRERLEQLTGSDNVWAYVYDIGPSWAVYEAGDCSDLFMVEYALDESGNVQLTDPVAVTRITTYVADMEPSAAAGTTSESRLVLTNLTGNSVQEIGGRSVEGLSTPERIEGRLLGSLGTGPDGGRIFEVQIIAYGDSKNSRRYPETVMRAAAPMYEGAPSFDHHRTDVELNTGTVVGLIGHYRNVKATESGLSAELHLLPSSTTIAELLDQTLENQAAGMPLLVGISHDVMTASKPITVNGRPFREVTAVLGVNSADVVVTPAAGGMATRMVATAATATHNIPTKENHTVTLKQLLALLRAAESAERAALLEQYAHVLEAAGLTADDAIHMAETAAAPATRSTETPAPAKLDKASAITGMIVERVIASAGLPAGLTTSILDEMPDTFTEAELGAKVESHKRLIEGLEKAGLAPTVKVTQDATDGKIAKLDAFFDQDWKNGYSSFKEAYVDITGVVPKWNDTEDFNRQILRESALVGAGDSRRLYDSSRSTESVTSATWGLILGDSITRRMVAEYSRMDFAAWKMLVTTIPVNDFRTQRVDRMGDYALLPTVNQGTPYQPLTTPGNEEATYAPAKRGGTEDITLETIANDDIRAISRVPQRLGIAAAQTIYKFVLDFFIAPITATYDSVATFNAAHNNTAATALSDTALSTGWATMLKQTSLSGPTSFMPVEPKFLLVPPDLRQLATVLCTSAVAVPAAIAAASNVPNVNQGLIPIIVPYWTATSTTAWFLAADPSRTPGIEIGLYQGKEEPDLFVQTDETVGSMFTSDKLTYKIRHIYGGTLVDHRGVYRGNS